MKIFKKVKANTYIRLFVNDHLSVLHMHGRCTVDLPLHRGLQRPCSVYIIGLPELFRSPDII